MFRAKERFEDLANRLEKFASICHFLNLFNVDVFVAFPPTLLKQKWQVLQVIWQGSKNGSDFVF
jgi:hypothetical protein